MDNFLFTRSGQNSNAIQIVFFFFVWPAYDLCIKCVNFGLEFVSFRKCIQFLIYTHSLSLSFSQDSKFWILCFFLSRIDSTEMVKMIENVTVDVSFFCFSLFVVLCWVVFRLNSGFVIYRNYRSQSKSFFLGIDDWISFFLVDESNAQKNTKSTKITKWKIFFWFWN